LHQCHQPPQYFERMIRKSITALSLLISLHENDDDARRGA
jgi:hypothetical protein